MSNPAVKPEADQSTPHRGGRTAGSYATDPIRITLVAGTYTVGVLGAAPGGDYYAYNVYAAAPADGLASCQPAVRLTHDSDLHLVTDRGWKIRPSAVSGERHVFIVPGGTRALRLASRAARRSDLIGPFVDDRRARGVLIGEIVVGLGKHKQPMEAHLTAPALDGWFAPQGRTRWTNGDATLPIDLAATAGAPFALAIQVLAAGPYPLPHDAVEASVARAA